MTEREHFQKQCGKNIEELINKLRDYPNGVFILIRVLRLIVRKLREYV